MRIAITGFMGCGKTRVARALAQRWNMEVFDLDEEITSRKGRSPAEIIVDEGEEAFRVIESEVLRELLATNSARVIALGGGAWIGETNRDLIHEHGYLSIWLDVPFAVCWSRIKASDEERPLGRTREQAQALYDQRKPIYRLATIHIPVSTENPEELIDLIAAKVTDTSVE